MDEETYSHNFLEAVETNKNEM